jgi:hypothetical protein
MIKKLKWRKENTRVWSTNLFVWCDLQVDILICKEDDYYRVCVDDNMQNLYNLGSEDTLVEAKKLAQREIELFVKVEFLNDN